METTTMTTTTWRAPTVEPIRVPYVAWAFVALALFLAYLVFQENGALLETSWERLHEFFHDGRHALGVPCH